MAPTSHAVRLATLAFAALSLVPFLGAAVRAQEPAERDEQPLTAIDLEAALDDLACSIKRSDAVAKDVAASLVEIEVKNGGAEWAEPLIFRITPKDRDAAPLLVERVGTPIHGRTGRLVGPKKRQKYPLQIPLSEKELRGARVTVEHASFWPTGSPESEIEFDERIVSLGPIEVERERSEMFGRTIDVSRFRVDNRTTYPIDVMFEMKFAGEIDGTALYRVHLGPEASEWVVLDQFQFDTSTEHGAGTLGVEVRNLRPVDWSAVVDDGQELARSELERAWDSWERVDPELFPLRARFRANVSEIGLFGSDGGRFDIVDAFDGFVTIEESGAIALTDLDGKQIRSKGESSVKRAMLDVAKQLARPAFAEQERLWRPRLIASGTPTRVEIDAASDWFGYSTVEVRLQDGRIAAFGPPGEDTLLVDHWTTSRTGPDGPWRVDSRWRDSQSQGVERRSFRWQPFEDSAVVARYEFHDEGLLVKNPKDVVISLSGWTASSPAIPNPEPPTGAVADRLREAWDGYYRYPSMGARLTGTYVAKTPGTDGTWGGYKKVEGTFDLGTFHSGFWRHVTTTVEGKKISEFDRGLLINAVEDRFLMWSGREMCARPLFDVAFAGATLTAEDDDWIGVEGMPTWSGIRVVDGRITAMRRGKSTITTIAWVDRDGALLPTRIEQLGGGGMVEFDWESPTTGWWFPSRAHFTAIFGSDWGPETLEMEVETVEP
ncbi:hypothetical protein Pla163_03060 [Planctomycetes bacterium Pla163]|uniref:Uncharacterized protein n=1 Tax=Rohdeia mirabilis TaxID=2528008 RepID=A0A518CVI7_9BACT|nr:hypothetical protein Pla163_03060 [Planctomycetes bacterium Pla163]